MRKKASILLQVLFGASLIACGVLRAAPIEGALDARLMREPDVSAEHIAFVYAGDIWVAPREGGTAVRLSSPRGEESFPRFSPDGKWIAFTGNYDGNQDIYIIPAAGGEPKRLTYHGAADRVIDWYPDGKSILFASGRESERNRFNKLFRVSIKGGLPERLPVPYGEFGEISPDGRYLVYTPISRDFRTWKRYRGGMAPDIWLFDLKQIKARRLAPSPANDAQPMWHEGKVYFLSDRGPHKRANIWVCDVKDGEPRQVTHFRDYDIHFPSIGPEDIVFENGGKLYLLSLKDEKLRRVDIRVVSDRATLKPRVKNVSAWIRNYEISPTGKRAAFEARGEIFSVPAERGVILNLTRTSGAAERYPAWSPDGKWIACFSDRNGEYELTLLPADGKGEPKTLTRLGPGFRYRPVWSPDGKKLAFIDQAMRLHVHYVDADRTDAIDQMMWLYHGDLQAFTVSWSSDSRWLAYAGDLENRHRAIILYDTNLRKRRQVTSGYYDDAEPTFDPEGKFLFYRSNRGFSPVYSDLQNTWVYVNGWRLVAAPLRKDVASPLAPRNDEEPVKAKETQAEEKPSEKAEKASKETKPASEKQGLKKAEKKEKEKAAGKPGVKIDLKGFEQRAVVLPPKPGRYSGLRAVKGKLLYVRSPNKGASGSPTLCYWDLEKREEKTILSGLGGYRLSADGKKLLVRQGSRYGVIDVAPGQKIGKPLPADRLEAAIDPVQEWKQIFTDAWRFERDYFYDPNLHGVNWRKVRSQYGGLLKWAVTRWDVNFLIGEMIAELNSSHTYRSGGDAERAPSRPVGYLGADFAVENGACRIKRILRGAPWDLETRSPLLEPGVKAAEGDYLLAVNGVPVDATKSPYAAFEGLAGQTVLLTLNSKPTMDGARDVLVKTLSSEARLRYLAWIEANRRRVEKASGGRIGYIYVPDTGQGGQRDLVRQFAAQFNKEGLIIDERFNSGGQIPDRFIELLKRPVYNYWGVRDGRDWQWPPLAHWGPKAMLINGWSGSGGDCFPFYFREAKLGPLIGMRTWGGLIGMTGAPGLIDGGRVTVPTFGIYSRKGKWIIEGYGVDPDIEVVDNPAILAKGRDPQLERAVRVVMKALKRRAPKPPAKPAYEDRSH